LKTYATENVIIARGVMVQWSGARVYQPATATMSSQSSKVDSTHRWHFTLHPSVELSPGTLTSVFNTFVHPTRALLSHTEGAEREWRSRSHRKHRYRFTGDPSKGGLQKFLNMFKIEYWNISWWVAWVRMRFSSHQYDKSQQ
jgi:hypothetical protein